MTGAGVASFGANATDNFIADTAGQTANIGAGSYQDFIFGSGVIADEPSAAGLNNGNANDFLLGLNNTVNLSESGATSNGNFILGYGANISGSSNVAMGYRAAGAMSGNGNIALGAFANPGSGSFVTAVGYGAMNGSIGDPGAHDGAVAIGSNAYSGATFPVAPIMIGSSPGAGVAIGDFAGQDSISQSSQMLGATAGQGSTLAESQVIGQGAGRNANIYVSTGIGIQALEFSSQLGTVAIGANAGESSKGQANTYLGYQTGYGVVGNDNVLVGNAANLHATAFNYASALGFKANAVSQGSALGAFATASGPHSVAFGFQSIASGRNSVSVGANSKDAGRENVVSIGAVGATRALINVTAGAVNATSSEAVNGSQLYAIEQRISALATSTQVPAARAATTGASSAFTASSGLVSQKPGPAGQGEISIGAGVGGANINVAGINGARTVSGVAAGQVSAASSQAVNGAQLYSTNQAVQAASGTANAALATAQNSVQYDAGSGQQSVTLDPGGAPAQMHNVAAGTAPGDAANVGQVQAAAASAVSQANAYTNLQLAAFGADFNRRLHQGLAGDAALANLPTSVIPGKGMIAVAVGGDSGEASLALGISKVFQDRRHTEFKASVAISPTGGNSQYGAGIGWHF